MLALRAAVEQTCASALETDLRLTKDGIIVLSHDESLKRTFGKESADGKVSESNYSSLTHLRTVREPHEPLARLDELLTYLASRDTRSDIWVMLDIKLHADRRLMMTHIAKTIASVPPHPQRPWNDRLVLGIWSETCLPLCTDLLPGFPAAYIGVSIDYAHRFLRSDHHYDNISFNMLTEAVIVEPSIVDDARKMGRPIMAWNVLRENWLEWCIGAGFDGVITDDPKRFDKLKRAWASSKKHSDASNDRTRPKKFGHNLHDLFVIVVMKIFNTALKWRAEELGVRIDGRPIR